jgi:hypothetical protein
MLALTLGAASRNLPAMAAGSLVLALVSFVCIVFGVLLSAVPGLGAVFAFGAPALAIAGIVLGGKAMSRPKQQGAVSGVGQAGVIASTIALVPALITAMTCGVCSAFCADGGFQTQRRFNVQFGTPQQQQHPGSGAAGSGAAQPQRPDTPADPGAPPPAFPPPPIAPKTP